MTWLPAIGQKEKTGIRASPIAAASSIVATASAAPEAAAAAEAAVEAAAPAPAHLEAGHVGPLGQHLELAPAQLTAVQQQRVLHRVHLQEFYVCVALQST